MHRVKDLQQEEKPREKLLSIGAKNLTNVELLSIILGTGGRGTSVIDTSREILNSIKGFSELINSDPMKFQKYKYIGKAKAAKLIALGEIGVRILKEKEPDHTKIKDPKDIYTLLKPEIINNKKETLYLFSLDTRNQLLSKDIITIGTINETLVHPREIFIKALEKSAVHIIIAHNHPSQKTKPSTHDLIVTTRIAQVGKELGIPLLDHVIVSESSFTSIKRDYLEDLTKLCQKGGDKSY